MINLCDTKRKNIGIVYELYNIILKEFKKVQRRKRGRSKKENNFANNQLTIDQVYRDRSIMNLD